MLALLLLSLEGLPSIASPEDYLGLVIDSIGGGNYVGSMEVLLQLGLSIEDSCNYSAEEMFVGCMLLVLDKAPHLISLQQWVG